MGEISYSRTPMGQLLYDLAFTDLTPKWLARKHSMTAAEVSDLRTRTRRAMLPKRKPKAWRERVVKTAVSFNRALDQAR